MKKAQQKTINLNRALVSLLCLNIKDMTNIQEIWKDVIGYDGLYQVSNLGRIKTVYQGHALKNKEGILKPLFSFNKKRNRIGYASVFLYKNCVPKQSDVHRLVAKAFIPNPDNKPQVNHIDGNKLNNALDNLEWVTASENQKHSAKIRKLC